MMGTQLTRLCSQALNSIYFYFSYMYYACLCNITQERRRYQPLKATRRRQRKADPLASPEAVKDIFSQLRAALPDIIPQRDKELMRLLRAMRHVQRYQATDTKRGRPGHWRREDLLQVHARLAVILERETSAHISIASFVDHHLRILDFPADVIAALTQGDINLFEAEQLARLMPERLSAPASKAKHLRGELLAAHLQTKASGARLRLRVSELLQVGPAKAEAHTEPEKGAAQVEELDDFDPYDPTHLFWEQLKQLGFAFREIRREDVTDEEIEELLKASEPILAILSRIQRRKERAVQKFKF